MRLATSPEHPPSTQTCPGGVFAPRCLLSMLMAQLRAIPHCLWGWLGAVQGRLFMVRVHWEEAPRACIPPAGHQQRRSRFHSKARGAQRALGAHAAPGASCCSGTSSAPEGGMFVEQGQDTGASPSSCAPLGFQSWSSTLGCSGRVGRRETLWIRCMGSGVWETLWRRCVGSGAWAVLGGAEPQPSAGALEIAFHGRVGWDTDSSTGRSERR